MATTRAGSMGRRRGRDRPGTASNRSVRAVSAGPQTPPAHPHVQTLVHRVWVGGRTSADPAPPREPRAPPVPAAKAAAKPAAGAVGPSDLGVLAAVVATPAAAAVPVGAWPPTPPHRCEAIIGKVASGRYFHECLHSDHPPVSIHSDNPARRLSCISPSNFEQASLTLKDWRLGSTVPRGEVRVPSSSLRELCQGGRGELHSMQRA